MPSEIQTVIERFRAAIEARDAKQMRYMAQQWLRIEHMLMGRIENLANTTYLLQQQGKTVSRSSIYQLEQYRDLLAQVKTEVNRYNRFAAEQISQAQRCYGLDGIDYTAQTIMAVYADARRHPEPFMRLPEKAIETMIGLAGDGTPLNKLLMADYQKTVLRMTQTLIDNTALGINPRITAKQMAVDMSGNLQRTLTIARTEQIRAFRIASTMSAKESGVVSGWIWRSALQDRTCIACLAMDGTEHGLDEELNDHPGGRCLKQWIVKGMPTLQAQSGQEWFNGLGTEKKKDILGQQKYEAWSSGAVKFQDFAAITHSDVWGSSVKVAAVG